MRLPEAIDRLLKPVNHSILVNAAQELSEHYRRSDRALEWKAEHYLAYAATRMPATYAVLMRIFEEITDFDIRSLLDLGAGPGTSLWAATEFYDFESVTLIERDKGFVDLGKKLANSQAANWVTRDITHLSEYPSSDLVVASYSLGELPPDKQIEVTTRMSTAAQKLVVAIEPGTPKGYADIIRIRDQLIKNGFHIIAPCPHDQACPMSGKDWCHFSERLERSRSHRLIKQAELNYEDEKYSYVIASREPIVHERPARIIKRPMKRPGHIVLDLCATEGLKRQTIAKSDPNNWRPAKKAEWGANWKPKNA